MASKSKPLRWIGSSRRDLKNFPAPARRNVGFALDFAQKGTKHPSAKPLQGFGGGSVLEIIESFDGDAYRAVYTVRFHDAIYVLHAFKKKSRHGIKTPEREIDLIKQRLRQAEEDYASKHRQEN